MRHPHIFGAGLLLGVMVGFARNAVDVKSPHDANGADAAAAPDSPGESPSSAPQGDPRIAALLEPIREKYRLPALGAAVLDSTGITAVAVVGVRARGEATGATPDDLWHLGSDTKAMTATMVAALVEQNKLSWDTRLSDVFPDLHLPARTGAITLLQLLSHRAGLPSNTDWVALSRSGLPLAGQRRAAVAQLASTELLSSPGEKFSYSNWGYVVAGAEAEQVTGKSYETLMQTILFAPLHMKSAGFGVAGTRGTLDQPWGHSTDGTPVQKDNPLVMAPAGSVHCSLEDWGRFISDQLRGSEAKAALLTPGSYTRLHSVPFGGSYALGWRTVDRRWGGGHVFTHAGSNTLNFAVVWMAPGRDFAELIVCNQGGSEKACDEVAGRLIALRKKGGGLP